MWDNSSRWPSLQSSLLGWPRLYQACVACRPVSPLPSPASPSSLPVTESPGIIPFPSLLSGQHQPEPGMQGGSRWAQVLTAVEAHSGVETDRQMVKQTRHSCRCPKCEGRRIWGAMVEKEREMGRPYPGGGAVLFQQTIPGQILQGEGTRAALRGPPALRPFGGERPGCSWEYRGALCLERGWGPDLKGTVLVYALEGFLFSILCYLGQSASRLSCCDLLVCITVSSAASGREDYIWVMHIKGCLVWRR